jgi:hypothetical protein
VNRKTPYRILVAGIPGSGKTTYCRWLEREKGFLHLDFDELFNNRGTEQKLALVRQLKHTAEAFILALRSEDQPIVIDWGFPPALLTLVSCFAANGMTPWWFDGDHAAARESFLHRGTGPIENFNTQMDFIEKEWRSIEKVVEDNIIKTVSAGPTYASTEYIYGRMFPVRKGLRGKA